MSPQVSVGMIIRHASHNLIFIYSANTKNFKECPKVFTGESRRKRVPTPMHEFTRSRNSQVDHQNIHQVDHVNIPSSPQISTCKTYIKCSQILKGSIRQDNFKGKTQFITREQRGRNIIRSKYNSKARDTSRPYHLKNTREREIKHIATGTYPQPRGRTTPSSSWRAPG